MMSTSWWGVGILEGSDIASYVPSQAPSHGYTHHVAQQRNAQQRNAQQRSTQQEDSPSQKSPSPGKRLIGKIGTSTILSEMRYATEEKIRRELLRPRTKKVVRIAEEKGQKKTQLDEEDQHGKSRSVGTTMVDYIDHGGPSAGPEGTGKDSASSANKTNGARKKNMSGVRRAVDDFNQHFRGKTSPVLIRPAPDSPTEQAQASALLSPKPKPKPSLLNRLNPAKQQTLRQQLQSQLDSVKGAVRSTLAGGALGLVVGGERAPRTVGTTAGRGEAEAAADERIAAVREDLVRAGDEISDAGAALKKAGRSAFRKPAGEEKFSPEEKSSREFSPPRSTHPQPAGSEPVSTRSTQPVFAFYEQEFDTVTEHEGAPPVCSRVGRRGSPGDYLSTPAGDDNRLRALAESLSPSPVHLRRSSALHLCCNKV